MHVAEMGWAWVWPVVNAAIAAPVSPQQGPTIVDLREKQDWILPAAGVAAAGILLTVILIKRRKRRR